MSDEQPEQFVAPTLSDRGFAHFEPIPSAYGGHIRVYESSSAMTPRIWVRIECPVDLNQPDGPTKEAVAHLDLENAVRLRDELSWLVSNHYQVAEKRPRVDGKGGAGCES